MDTTNTRAVGEISHVPSKTLDQLPVSRAENAPNTTNSNNHYGPLSRLRYAAQPDVVLSQERDAYYAETLLGESASEILEALIGSRRAVILGPELKALASCLYFGLTNFAGDMYCT